MKKTILTLLFSFNLLSCSSLKNEIQTPHPMYSVDPINIRVVSIDWLNRYVVGEWDGFGPVKIEGSFIVFKTVEGFKKINMFDRYAFIKSYKTGHEGIIAGSHFPLESL